MRRPNTLLPILFLLLSLTAAPMAAQSEPSAEPASPSAEPAVTAVPSAASESSAPEATAEATVPPLPTAVPLGDGPLVQAVLFFSPTCGHCHYVITDTLPPLFADNGGEPSVTIDESRPREEIASYLMSNGHLQLLLVDVTMPDGQAMFLADAERLDIDGGGVPRLDVEDIYLVGSGDIPDQLPGIVERGLAGEGIDWPAIPGLGTALAPFIAAGSVPDPDAATEPDVTAGPEGMAEPGSTIDPDAADGPGDAGALIPIGDGGDDGPLGKFDDDPAGNTISVIVLVLLLVSLIGAPLLAARGSLHDFPRWLVPVLAVVGAGVAAYLATVETSGSEAVCGPVGDCNAVQQSEYAELFGIPIGVLGVIGYLLLGGLWVVSRVAGGAPADWALVLIGLGAFGGTLFSAYLTFLEPFVIGATCMWCITSALVMLALLWVSAGPAWAAWQRRRGDTAGPDAQATLGS